MKKLLLILIVFSLLAGCREWKNPFDPNHSLGEDWAPADLNIEVLSNSEIQLSWTNDQKLGSGYIIERKQNNGSFEEIATSNQLTYTDNTIIQDTTYYYRIRAFADDNRSEPSSAKKLQWIQEGQLIWSYSDSADIDGFDISPDGKLIGSVCYRSTAVWDALSGEQVWKKYHKYFVQSIQFSPDNAYLLSLGMYDANSGALVWDIGGADFADFSDDNMKLFAGNASGGTYLSNLTSRSQIWYHLWSNSGGTGLSSVDFSPDNVQVAAGYLGLDKKIIVRGMDNANPIWYGEHGANVSYVNFNNDGATVLSAGESGFLKVWDMSGAQPLWTGQHSAKINQAKFSPDGNYIASVSDDNTVRLWDASTGASLWTSPGEHSDKVLCMNFNSDGTLLATGSADLSMKVWNIPSGGEVPIWSSLYLEDDVTHVQFSDDGGLLVACGGDEIKVWAAKSRWTVSE